MAGKHDSSFAVVATNIRFPILASHHNQIFSDGCCFSCAFGLHDRCNLPIYCQCFCWSQS